MRTLLSGSPLRARKRGLTRNQPCRYLDLGLPGSIIVRKYISVAQTTQSGMFCYGSPSSLMHYSFVGGKSQELSLLPLFIPHSILGGSIPGPNCHLHVDNYKIHLESARFSPVPLSSS